MAGRIDTTVHLLSGRRIGDHLPEHITIDPDLSEDQNEERWWTHHWGLVRQDLRAAYPGVSDQVIDGPVHELYRVHHHDRHERRFSSHHLNPSYVFEDMHPEFEIAYGSEDSTLHYEEKNRLRQIIFGDSEYEPMGHEISRDILRDYAVRLTRLGIMNFGSEGLDYRAIITIRSAWSISTTKSAKISRM